MAESEMRMGNKGDGTLQTAVEVQLVAKILLVRY